MDTDLKRRLAALTALLGLVAAAALVIVSLLDSLLNLIGALLALTVAAPAAFTALTRRDWVRYLAWVVTAGAVFIFFLAAFDAPRDIVRILLIIALAATAVAAARYALRLDVMTLKTAPTPGVAVGEAERGVLIMNPKSGGGKVEQFDLVAEAAKRGIEPVMLRPGDDLLELAGRSIAGGVDVIGMAGGDGSQAVVAAIASQQSVPHVVIPAGTRNHFALDLGLDRDDLVGALDAYTDAVERSVDLATVNGRVFVNNVSLGLYAKIVQSDEYRNAKAQTALNMLPDLLGPHAEPFDLRFTGPGGTRYLTAHLILVSNNAYQLTRLGGSGTRESVSAGELGIVAARIDGPERVAELVALEAAGQVRRFSGWLEWTASDLSVDSGAPIEAGIDGEALIMEPPLEFRTVPGALRIRLPHHAPGISPAAIAASSRLTLDNARRVWDVARGRA